MKQLTKSITYFVFSIHLLCCPFAAAQVDMKNTIVNLSLKQGTLGQFVELLSKESSTNILLANDLRDLAVPYIALNNVSAYQALTAICTILHSEAALQETADAHGKIYSIISPQEKPEATSRVFHVTSPAVDEAAGFQKLLTDIKDAAKLACEVNAKAHGRKTSSFPIIEAHEATGILIVAGFQEEVDLVAQVIQALGGVSALEAANRNRQLAAERSLNLGGKPISPVIVNPSSDVPSASPPTPLIAPQNPTPSGEDN